VSGFAGLQIDEEWFPDDPTMPCPEPTGRTSCKRKYACVTKYQKYCKGYFAEQTLDAGRKTPQNLEDNAGEKEI